MGRHRRKRHHARADKPARPYALIARGRDGRPRVERFDNAAAYRARLMSLDRTDAGRISIEEIVGLLDP